MVIIVFVVVPAPLLFRLLAFPRLDLLLHENRLLALPLEHERILVLVSEVLLQVPNHIHLQIQLWFSHCCQVNPTESDRLQIQHGLTWHEAFGHYGLRLHHLLLGVFLCSSRRLFLLILLLISFTLLLLILLLLLVFFVALLRFCHCLCEVIVVVY